MLQMPFLIDFNTECLEKSWNWLNDPEIKELTMTPDFTKQDQINFYNSLPQKTDYWIKGIAENGACIGAMGLKNITKVDAEYWGYIGEKDSWGKGIGKFMLEAAIEKAQLLKLEKIYLKVLKTNTRAIQLYLKKGFLLEQPGAVVKYYLPI